MLRRSLFTGLLLLTVFGAVAAAPGIAAAHGDEGDMTVVTAKQGGERTIDLEVGILFSNDDELATDATVTVTGTGPDGAVLAATPLPRTEGAKYGASVDVPVEGTWNLTITSTRPDATAQATVEVTAAPAQTTVTSTTEATTTTAASASTTAAPAPTTDATDDEASSSGLLIVGGVVALAGVAAIAWVIASRRKQS